MTTGRLAATVTTAAGLALLLVVCLGRRDEVAEALGAVSWPVFAALVALHVATLAARSEAWRVSLQAIDGRDAGRRAIHGANAGAFLAGTVQAHVAMPVRISLLRRFGGQDAPRPLQIAVADVPLFVLEVGGTCALLALAAATGTMAWWVLPGAVALGVGLPLGGRALLHCCGDTHRFVRGLAILALPRRRVRLTLLVGAVCLLGVARAWAVLAVAGLPHGLQEVALVYAALGVLGLLPLGPSASPAATVAVAGTGDVGAALAAGLVISATSIAAVLVYAAVVTVVVLAATGGTSRRSAASSPRRPPNAPSVRRCGHPPGRGSPRNVDGSRVPGGSAASGA